MRRRGTGIWRNIATASVGYWAQNHSDGYAGALGPRDVEIPGETGGFRSEGGKYELTAKFNLQRYARAAKRASDGGCDGNKFDQMA